MDVVLSVALVLDMLESSENVAVVLINIGDTASVQDTLSWGLIPMAQLGGLKASGRKGSGARGSGIPLSCSLLGSREMPWPANVDVPQIFLFMGTCEERAAYLRLEVVLFKCCKM